ncbi:hypothetical protein Tco_1122155 [Tanacetum coccineum]|uniref:Uncharacterized protein n=1 Tax=Tanacetum coccineum TaxID=301880 RepID=A0ABQ5J151_9ASTR
MINASDLAVEVDPFTMLWYFSFGRHLEDLHLTWAHLRLRTNTKTLEDLCLQSLETASQAIHDAVTTHKVTTSQHFETASARTDSYADLEDSTYDVDTTKMRRRCVVRCSNGILNFGKRFTPQQELSAEQAFWFRISNPTIESSNKSPVKVDVPSELPKVSLANASLKKLKFLLAQFDFMVKKRTTHDARTESEWEFEHTKVIFNNEIISFLKSLKDIFNVFDKDLLNEIMEVQIVFDQMDAAVQQSLVDKHCLEIAKK